MTSCLNFEEVKFLEECFQRGERDKSKKMKAEDIVREMRDKIDEKTGKRIFSLKDPLTEAQIKSWLSSRAAAGKPPAILDEDQWSVEAIRGHRWVSKKIIE